jgi:hypothetical protein
MTDNTHKIRNFNGPYVTPIERIADENSSACCGNAASAVYYNPYNHVIQCHNCGHVYEPKPCVLSAAEVFAQRTENADNLGSESIVGHWEAVPDEPSEDDTKINAQTMKENGRFWRVRWSVPDEDGRWLYVRHYGGNGTGWNRNAAESDAEKFNREQRIPTQFGYRAAKEEKERPTNWCGTFSKENLERMQQFNKPQASLNEDDIIPR